MLTFRSASGNLSKPDGETVVKQRSRGNSAYAAWAGLLSCAAMGCDRGPKMVPVTGRVIYQGEPLAFGSVMFQPEGAADPSRGDIRPDGTFSLATQKGIAGVAVGKCRVRVTAFEGQRQRQVQGGEEPTLGRSVIPRKFQSFGASGIQIEVTEGMPLPLTIDLDQFAASDER